MLDSILEKYIVGIDLTGVSVAASDRPEIDGYLRSMGKCDPEKFARILAVFYERRPEQIIELTYNEGRYSDPNIAKSMSRGLVEQLCLHFVRVANVPGHVNMFLTICGQFTDDQKREIHAFAFDPNSQRRTTTVPPEIDTSFDSDPLNLIDDKELIPPSVQPSNPSSVQQPSPFGDQQPSPFNVPQQLVSPNTQPQSPFGDQPQNTFNGPQQLVSPNTQPQSPFNVPQQIPFNVPQQSPFNVPQSVSPSAQQPSPFGNQLPNPLGVQTQIPVGFV